MLGSCADLAVASSWLGCSVNDNVSLRFVSILYADNLLLGPGCSAQHTEQSLQHWHPRDPDVYNRR